MIWQQWLMVIAVWNLIVFGLYGIDKWKAKRQKWRIPEAVLLGTACCCGAIGALAGMEIFRHKTRKWKFRILIPLFLILQAAVIWGIIR